MDQFKPGDIIEHRLMPGFTMPVLETRECETDSNRPEPHLAYKVEDPEGNEDWLCAYDVQRPSVHAQAREAVRGMWNAAFGHDPF
jgi:hypothetical protein